MSDLQIIIWDVQHGNAVYVRTPNNRHMVFDLGVGDYSGNNQLFSPLRELRAKYAAHSLDFVMVTHPHRDHIDDILNFDSFSPRVFCRPKHLSRDDVMKNVRDQDRAKFDKYFEINDAYSVNITGTYDDTIIPDNYGGIKIQFFSTPSLPVDNINNHSIITVLEYLGGKIIIPGDNECSSLDLLMNRNDFKSAILNSDILMAPHHGRESACHDEFLSIANPIVSVISDGSICDTSANPKYSAKSRGWSVHKRSTGQLSERRLLTTNSDGEVYITLGPSSNSQYARFLTIETA
jgi:beta-lactamase superfamily II metal-dependent hydrolase